MRKLFTYNTLDELALGLNKSRDTIDRINEEGEISEIYKKLPNGSKSRVGFLFTGVEQNWNKFLLLAVFLGSIPSFISRYFKPAHLTSWFTNIDNIKVDQIALASNITYVLIMNFVIPIIGGLLITPSVVSFIKNIEWFGKRIGIIIYWIIWIFLLLVAVYNFILTCIGK